MVLNMSPHKRKDVVRSKPEEHRWSYSTGIFPCLVVLPGEEWQQNNLHFQW